VSLARGPLRPRWEGLISSKHSNGLGLSAWAFTLSGVTMKNLLLLLLLLALLAEVPRGESVGLEAFFLCTRASPRTLRIAMGADALRSDFPLPDSRLM